MGNLALIFDPFDPVLDQLTEKSICMAGDWMVSLGALLLFATNMVAIALGSALVFRLHGIKTPDSRRGAALTFNSPGRKTAGVLSGS